MRRCAQRLFSQLRWTLHCHGFLRCASASDERCVLYWGHALPPPAALSRLPPHCRVLHFPGLQEVSHKDLLAANVERQRRRTRSLTLFPHIPTAFALPRSGREWLRQHRAEGGAVHAEVEALLDALHSREDGGACAEQWTDDAESAAFYSGHAEAAAEPPPSAGRAPLWILKPARAGSGHGVVVVDLQQPPSPAVLRALSRPSLVAQRYVERPLLLDGCKVDLRLYVLLLSSLSPARVQPCRTSAARFPEFPFQVFLYEDGLMRLASLPYPRDAAALSEPNALSSPFVHLTNNAVNAQRGAGWGALRNRAFRDWLEALRCGHAEAEGVHGHRLAEAVTVGVEQCVLSALSSSPALLRVGASPACAAHFALLGVDVLLDCDGRAWLCEVNHLPDLQVAASPYSPVFPVDARVKIGVIADALTLLGLPRGEAGTDSPDNADTPGRWTRAIDDGEAERHRVGGFRRLA